MVAEVSFTLQVTAGSGDSSSVWHFLTSEEKIPRCGNGPATGDEIGLDAAYLVSVIAEQALVVHAAAATRKTDAGRVGRRIPCFATASDRETVRRGRRPAARRRRAQATEDGPEAVRRLLCDVYADAAAANIAGDADLVRFVLGRLHAVAVPAAPVGFRLFRCARRRGALGPPLAMFLRQLYDVSHATCWHLDEWRRRWDRDELRSLGAFARLLCRNDVPPSEALLDAIDKGTVSRRVARWPRPR